MKIDYKVEEIVSNVFAVIIPDDYHRPMLFMRAQEYYESPNEKFRSQSFSIFDYIEWYSRLNGNSFTYAQDWGGFNIPYEVVRDCYQVSPKESFYDEYMMDILGHIREKMEPKPAYLLGVANTTDDTFLHELCHGLYYTNREYRDRANEITSSISKSNYNKLKSNLKEMGYTDHVIDDEVQAYLTMNWDYQRFGKGVSKLMKEKLHNQYLDNFNKFYKI